MTVMKFPRVHQVASRCPLDHRIAAQCWYGPPEFLPLATDGVFV